MEKRVLRILKEFIPPIALRGMRWVVPREFGYKGDFLDYQSALDAADGYDRPEILERVATAARKVKSGEAVFERDSVCQYHEEYRWPALACLLRIAVANGGRLRVLDFGGALGSFWFQHRKHFQDLVEVRWAVVEQPHYVKCGNEEFVDETIEFYETIDECMADGEIDVIFASGVLQYMSEPYVQLRQFTASGVRYLLLDRTPFIESNSDRLTVQYVPPEIYSASYPAWFFSRAKFMEKIGDTAYRVESTFDAFDGFNIGNFEGVLLVKN